MSEKKVAIPGEDGDRLCDVQFVLRVCPAENMDADQGKVSAVGFEMGSDDKSSELPHLSTFEDSLTTCQQAIDLTGKTTNVFVCGILVKSIRSLKPIPEPDIKMPSLDVQWFKALRESPSGVVVDTRPGAIGHCGIVGLDRGSNGKKAKALRKSLRSQLADLAQSDIRLKNF